MTSLTIQKKVTQKNNVWWWKSWHCWEVYHLERLYNDFFQFSHYIMFEKKGSWCAESGWQEVFCQPEHVLWCSLDWGQDKAACSWKQLLSCQLASHWLGNWHTYIADKWRKYIGINYFLPITHTNIPDVTNLIYTLQDFMKNLWIPNVFVYNLNSFTGLDCLKKLAGLWIVKDKDLFYNQVKTGFLYYKLFRKRSIIGSIFFPSLSLFSGLVIISGTKTDMIFFFVMIGHPRDLHVSHEVQQIPFGWTFV